MEVIIVVLFLLFSIFTLFSALKDRDFESIRKELSGYTPMPLKIEKHFIECKALAEKARIDHENRLMSSKEPKEGE